MRNLDLRSKLVLNYNPALQGVSSRTITNHQSTITKHPSTINKQQQTTNNGGARMKGRSYEEDNELRRVGTKKGRS